MSTRVKKTSAIHHSWINFSLPSIWSRFLASSCSCHRAQMKLRLQCRTMWPQQFLSLFIRSDIDNSWKDSYRVLSVIPQTFAWIIIVSSMFPLPFGIPNLQITRFPFQHWNCRDLSRSLLSSQITHEIMQWGPYDGANLQFLLSWCWSSRSTPASRAECLKVLTQKSSGCGVLVNIWVAPYEKGDLDKPSRKPVGAVGLPASSSAGATWLCQCYLSLWVHSALSALPVAPKSTQCL